jgi:hypothetical protein
LEESDELLFLLLRKSANEFWDAASDNHYFCSVVKITSAIAASRSLYERIRWTRLGDESFGIEITAYFDGRCGYQNIRRTWMVIKNLELLIDACPLPVVEASVVKEEVDLRKQLREAGFLESTIHFNSSPHCFDGHNDTPWSLTPPLLDQSR